MAIVAGDILLRLSGGAANTDPALSLGGIMSTTTLAPAGIFDDVTGVESSAGDTEYRCIYVLNNHGSLTLQNAKIWIQANTPSATTTIEIALAGEGLNATAETVANENTAPVGESFSAAPVDYTSGLTLGNIPFGQRFAVWVKRTINAGTSAVADGFTLRVQGDTAP